MIELFNLVLEQADDKGLLSGEHFSVDGTLIQAWARHKSFVQNTGSGLPFPTPNLHASYPYSSSIFKLINNPADC